MPSSFQGSDLSDLGLHRFVQEGTASVSAYVPWSAVCGRHCFLVVIRCIWLLLCFYPSSSVIPEPWEKAVDRGSIAV